MRHRIIIYTVPLVLSGPAIGLFLLFGLLSSVGRPHITAQNKPRRPDTSYKAEAYENLLKSAHKEIGWGIKVVRDRVMPRKKRYSEVLKAYERAWSYLDPQTLDKAIQDFEEFYTGYPSQFKPKKLYDGHDPEVLRIQVHAAKAELFSEYRQYDKSVPQWKNAWQSTFQYTGLSQENYRINIERSLALDECCLAMGCQNDDDEHQCFEKTKQTNPYLWKRYGTPPLLGFY